MRSLRHPVYLLVTLLVAAGCNRAARPGPVAGPAPACRLLAGAPGVPDTVTIGLVDSLDLSHAPVARTDGERLVYSLLFPRLVRLDCEGRPVAGLAREWTPEGKGRWRLRLRDTASFSDGTPLTAAAVVSSWKTTGLPGDSVEALDSRTLLLFLDSASDSLPPWLTTEAFAPVLRRAEGWPLGAGPYRAAGDTGSGLLLVPPPDARRLPVLRIRTAPGDDPRDLLDEGADLVVTSDPATIDYARAQSGFSAIPLPWNRVYLLVLPAERDDGSAPEPLRAALAGDAVRVEARAAADSLPLHAPDAGAAGDAAPSARVVYSSTDRTAGELARRLVALAARGGADSVSVWVGRALPEGRTLVATGLRPGEFAGALRRREAAAYIMSWDRFPVPSLPAGTVGVPLIETRDRAVVRTGTGGFEIQGDGTLRVRESAP